MVDARRVPAYAQAAQEEPRGQRRPRALAGADSQVEERLAAEVLEDEVVPAFPAALPGHEARLHRRLQVHRHEGGQ